MRLKIIAGNFVVLVVTGLAAYTVVRSQIREEINHSIDSEILRDSHLFHRSWRLTASHFLEYVENRAGSQQMRDVFGGLDLSTRRNRAFDAASRTSQWFGDPARGRSGAPDIVAITDETGKVLARDKDRNRLYGVQLGQRLPVVQEVLRDGVPRHDTWVRDEDHKILQVGVSAVRNEGGATLGTLVVGYDLSNGLAASESKILGRDVAFVSDGRVYSSSLAGDLRGELETKLFGGLKAQTQKALNGGEESSAWHVEMGGDDWIGVVAHLPMSPSAALGYVVVANRSAQLAMADVANIILVLTVLGALIMVVYGFIVGSGLLKPLEEIEEGVLAVINGRTDLRLNTDSNEFGGLAFRINQLINVFTGVSEGSEDGAESGGGDSGDVWAAAPAAPAGGSSSASSSTGSSAGTAASGGSDVIDDPAVAGPLAAQEEAAYLGQLFQQYVQAKTAAGENVSNIPEDKFSQRVLRNAQTLAKKHGVKDVRFQVENRAGQIVLRPVLIR